MSTKEHVAVEGTDISADGSEDDTYSQDMKEMAKLGKKQQLRRNFELWSILGFSCITMVTWAGQLFTFVQGLENGGPEGLVISFLVTWTAMAAIIASLAELMSMWPTSGGQYHWTYTLAPPDWAAFLSYISGWQCVIAWQALVASGTFLGGTFIQGLIILNNEDSTLHRWQGTLLGYAVLLAVVLFLTVFAKWLPKLEWAVLILYVAGYVVVLVTVTVLTPSYATTHDIFQVFINGGGWSSQGVSWWVGLQGVVFSWLGADGAIHMSEEVRNASRVLPWSLLASIAINGVLGFSILIAVLFCGGDLLAALDSRTGYPIIQIFTFATGSVAGGTGLSAILCILVVFAATSGAAAASRELWAFARDRGVPGYKWVSWVHKPSKLPLAAIFIVVLVALLLNLINIGNSVALNAVVSLTIAGFMGSYLLPIGLLLYRRVQAVRGKGRELPWGPWTLGRWSGIAINVYALIWALLFTIWSFFPPVVSPTPQTMNWSSLVYGTVTIFAVLFWFIDGRRRYHGPVRDAADNAIEPIVNWERL